jgi:hypothetical protein
MLTVAGLIIVAWEDPAGPKVDHYPYLREIRGIRGKFFTCQAKVDSLATLHSGESITIASM